MMPDTRKCPRPCIGTHDAPCPHGAVVVTRYAKRCKSCAAKVRSEGRDMAAVMTSVREAQQATRRRRRAAKIGYPVHESLPAPHLRDALRAHGFSVCEASREVFGDNHTLHRQLARGRVDDAALFVLSEMLGEVVA